MFRVSYLAALALPLLASGCSSTLNEYRCTSAADCTGEQVGQCEASGHCSFADPTCDSGFRYGDNSGSNTDICVGEETTGPDASMTPGTDGGAPQDPDAPIAILQDATIDCGRTSMRLNGSMSHATGFRTLEEFEWSIIRNGQVIDRIGRAPGDTMWRGIHRQGGSFTNPTLNMPTYHEQKAYRVDVASGSQNNEKLRANLDTAGGGSPNIRVSFAIGSANGDTNQVAGTFRLLDALGQELLGESINIDGKMVAHSFTYDSNVSVQQPIGVEFRFDVAGTYWVDNVTAVNINNGTDLAINGSAENDTSSWTVETDITGAPAPREDLPESLRQNGAYRVELRVTDSDNRVSAPDSLVLTLEDCP